MCEGRTSAHRSILSISRESSFAALMAITIAFSGSVAAQDAAIATVSQGSDSPDAAQSSKATQRSAQVDSKPLHSTGWSTFLDGQLALGAGMTYQYDGSKGTTLGIATYTWRDDNYELAAIRFFTAQTRRGDTLAHPNWVFEFSRRWRFHWRLIDHSGLQLFFGAGAAYKNEADDIDGSHLNFAEQLGWRFPRQANGGHVEFAIRHMSNAGLKKPNKGEDFLTLAYVF
jgi:hypothetical protein